MVDNKGEKDVVLTDTQQAILNVAEVNPTFNNHQIANKLVTTGHVKSIQATYDALKRSDYTRLKLAELRSRLHEDHARTIMPLAHKRLKKALKNKDLAEKEAFPYVKLAYNKGMADKEEATTQVQVNIEEMRQIIIDGTKRGE